MPTQWTLQTLAAGLVLAACALLAGAPAAHAQPIADSTSIEALLVDADADVRAARLTSPPGNNALERYRRVLALDPRNTRARDGLLEVVRRYVELADEAIARGLYARAGEYLDRAQTVVPGNELVAVARADLEQARGRAARSLQLGTSAAPAANAPAPGFSTSPAPAGGVAPAPVTALSSSPAPPPSTVPAVTPHRLAIFPFETIVPCFMQVGRDVRRAAERLVDERPDAELVWSYYASDADEREIPAPAQLWTDNRARPVPRPAAVADAANAIGANTVLMAWYFCSQSERIMPDTYDVQVFIVDAQTGRVVSSTRKLAYGPDAVRELLEQTWNRS